MWDQDTVLAKCLLHHFLKIIRAQRPLLLCIFLPHELRLRQAVPSKNPEWDPEDCWGTSCLRLLLTVEGNVSCFVDALAERRR